MSENREYISYTEEQGDIYISEEVLAMIAGAAALEVEGVVGLAGGNFGEQLLGTKNLNRGVSVRREDNKLVLNVSITIQYGYSVPELAKKVQETIISNIEATSGLAVDAVNIRVGGVSFEKTGR